MVHVPARGLLVTLNRRVGGLLRVHRVQATSGQAAVHKVADQDPQLAQALDGDVGALTVRRDAREEQGVSTVDVAHARDNRLIHDDLANRALLGVSDLGKTLHGLGVGAGPGVQGIRPQLRLSLDALLIRDEITAVGAHKVSDGMVFEQA